MNPALINDENVTEIIEGFEDKLRGCIEMNGMQPTMEALATLLEINKHLLERVNDLEMVAAYQFERPSLRRHEHLDAIEQAHDNVAKRGKQDW